MHGIPFKLETHEEFNGMVCKGNILKLPTDHDYNRLYILAAAAEKDVQGVFRVGKSEQEVVVPSYTGFIGQWGHTGHTEGYLKDSEVAYVGTHRHSSGGDHPYEFTYMFSSTNEPLICSMLRKMFNQYNITLTFSPIAL